MRFTSEYIIPSRNYEIQAIQIQVPEKWQLCHESFLMSSTCNKTLDVIRVHIYCTFHHLLCTSRGMDGRGTKGTEVVKGSGIEISNCCWQVTPSVIGWFSLSLIGAGMERVGKNERKVSNFSILCYTISYILYPHPKLNKSERSQKNVACWVSSHNLKPCSCIL